MPIDHKKEPREMAGIMASASEDEDEFRWVRVMEYGSSVGLVIAGSGKGEVARLTVAEARRLADQLYTLAERTEKRLGLK